MLARPCWPERTMSADTPAGTAALATVGFGIAALERCDNAVTTLATCMEHNARVDDKRYEEVQSALAALSQRLNRIEAVQQQLINFVSRMESIDDSSQHSSPSAVPADPEQGGTEP